MQENGTHVPVEARPSKRAQERLYVGDEPMRAELLSSDRLERQARRLASRQRWAVEPNARATPVLTTLNVAERMLREFNSQMAEATREAAPMSPSTEWLLDNFYLIDEHIREARENLPPRYSTELPRLSSGALREYPRIYEMLVLLIAHTDARLDRDTLVKFVDAYQQISPLTIGEIWATPITLRIALIENLRRLAIEVGKVNAEEAAAERWANDIIGTAHRRPEAVHELVRSLDQERHAAAAPFLIRFSQRFEDPGEVLMPVARWLEDRFAESGTTREIVLAEEHQREAANQVSIANSITSLRFLAALDWQAFFEEVSLVEHALREDPAGVYEDQDFRSRDRYRHALETLAKRSPLSEVEVAEALVSIGLEALDRSPADMLRAHVGYYLVAEGRYEFEVAIRYSPTGLERLHRGPFSNHALLYWGTLAVITTLLALTIDWYASARGVAGVWAALLTLLVIVPLSEVGVAIVNRIATALFPPRVLPRLDYQRPLSEEHRTLVVIPALLGSVKGAQSIIDNLEVRYLANVDPNMHFGVIGDLRGANEQVTPADEAIIDAARTGIEKLNRKYGRGKQRPFHLFIRGRRFNEREGTWMGWERKRGALTEFNRLLTGASDTSFISVIGDENFLPGVTFVITLDADTVLPRDNGRKLVATIAHPLNRANYDPVTRKVVRGYGLVQPRVDMSLPASEKTMFAKLFSGRTGIDPYAGAVSDTYMDVFGEGSFTGKGIYEVSIFNSALENRFPENAILSHDLLEGCFLRVALASDTEVLDDYPASYSAHVARLHRWVRGDWQTTPWLLPSVPTESGRRESNPLGTLCRWKIVDNLRRSLFAPTLALSAGLGWWVIPGARWPWTLFVMSITLFPAYFPVTQSLLLRSGATSFTAHFGTLWEDFVYDTERALFNFATLPHQTLQMLDASFRSLWRTYVTHKKMLEWETAADVERRLGNSVGDTFRRMWPSLVLAVVLALPPIVLAPISSIAVIPVLALWLAAPWLAYRVSAPIVRVTEPLTERDQVFLRRAALKTWRFFETFVRNEDHWLAPDNFQEDPKGEIAHRTSPTNMGLQLLTNLTAYDLGFAGIREVYVRCSRTLETMAGLERYRGHFYNWYDTLTLQPLRPSYVSTVDSGNLAGHLLTLRAGLFEMTESPILGDQLLHGLADEIRLAVETLVADKGYAGPADAVNTLRHGLEETMRRVQLTEPPHNVGEWHTLLTSLAEETDSLAARAEQLVPAGNPPAPPAAEPFAEWLATPLGRIGEAILNVRNSVHEYLGILDTLVPWAPLMSQMPRSLWEAEADGSLSPLAHFVPSLVGLAEGLEYALVGLERCAAERTDDEEAVSWCRQVADGIIHTRRDCIDELAKIRLLADICHEMWEHTDFSMLFDQSRLVFSIGFNTAEGRLDPSFYDMLASECRLASFLAIAKGDVPQEHWFRLGRMVTQIDGSRALVSWSASMFEYLMPLLVMDTWPETLLGQTYRGVVKRQEEYGAERGVPWGISESAFNAKDVELTYQYQAFGVPGLGLKRGLSDDLVIAPYATCLALAVDRRASIDNLARLAKQGGEGRFGYYESIDYTPGRVPAGEERAVVKAYFAHHQGMSLLALGNALDSNSMRTRFHADPLVRSAELLLQERVPHAAAVTLPNIEEVKLIRSARELPPPQTRSYPLADTPVPATHFLSNGRYSVMVTNAGGGYSRWKDLSVTRYREDVTRDCWGTFFYIRDLGSGHVWSAAHQPTGTPAEEYHCTFSVDKAEFRRLDGDFETHTEVVVSPEDDVELRRLTITNRGRHATRLEVTSYLEIAIAPQGADQAHKAFSNLFVETEAIPENHALLFSRRPRKSGEERSWGMHVLACDEDRACDWEYETDREKFIGRLRNVAAPAAIYEGAPMTGTAGAVLDPVCAVRQIIHLAAGESAHVTYATGVADTREEAERLAEKYSDMRSAQRVSDLSWTASQIELRDLGIAPDEAVTYQRLASRLLLTDPYSPLKRFPPAENTLPMSGLWPLGISGDLPILLVNIERLEEMPLVRQALTAHGFWRHSGFRVDLVILTTSPTTYSGELIDRLRGLIRGSHALQLLDKPGGVFLRAVDQMPNETRNLLDTVARVVLDGDRGPIALQLDQRAERPDLPLPLVKMAEPATYAPVPLKRPELLFDNGYGGFDAEAGEYVIVLENGDTTPAPWVNILANPSFGCMVSEAGIGCSWAENSHENRITTWNNDSVSDGSGEYLYVRDEATGEFWSPTPLPVRSKDAYVVRHGHGYSRFEHTSHGIAHELDWFVPFDEPVRLARLRLRNLGDTDRQLSVTQFIEWVLGDSRSKANQQVVTWYEESTETLTAHNHYNLDFPGRPAFLACDRPLDSYTGSRTEFVGRNRQPSNPAALEARGLGGQTGRFHDNCGALMTKTTLPAGGTWDVTFLLGQCEHLDDVRRIVEKYRKKGAVARALTGTKARWDELLGTLRVETPDTALDLLVNGNLLYQSLACRVWGRTAMYQSSGAFGFRDQLQDMLSLTFVKPELMREQIIEAASHQFLEGDAMHWWQPKSGRGVRTHISDDRHWLSFVVTEYIRATGDYSILDEEAPYLFAPELPLEKEDEYLIPVPADERGTIYDHCIRAFEFERRRGMGPHGLPKIGGGDWNDGMNRVGHEGQGESVWLAWFLDVCLRRFAAIAEERGDVERAEDYRGWAGEIVAAVERDGWDGAWYRRAFFDDGTPLGTKDAPECKIDAIAQAWAVVSGAGDVTRASRALDAVDEHLVRWEDGLILLLHPPFDVLEHDPGYIKGYVPGVRENGGQYTHAAVWVVLAYLLNGGGDMGVELLDLINPVLHTETREETDVYRVEPYVLAADVYAVEPHVGRGGWTWYTGSASWYYRVATQHLLGVRVNAEDGERYLVVDPCIPKAWPGFNATYRFGEATYRIEVHNPRGVNRGVARVEIDGSPREDLRIPLDAKSGEHEVVVTLLGG